MLHNIVFVSDFAIVLSKMKTKQQGWYHTTSLNASYIYMLHTCYIHFLSNFLLYYHNEKQLNH